MFPLLSTSAVSPAGTVEFSQLLQRSFDVLTIAAVFVVALCVPLAPELVLLVGGEAFEESTGPLRILMFGAALTFFASLLLLALIALDRQRSVLLLTFVALVVNLVLNVALIPEYSYTAAAAIATGTQLVIVVGALYLVRRFVGFVPSSRVVVRATVAGAAVFLALFAFTAPLLVGLAGGTALYGLLLLAFRIDRDLDLAQVLRRA